MTLEFHEHDAVSELKMTGDNSALDCNRRFVEPESDMKGSADGKGHHQLDVTTSATEIGGSESHGDIVTFLVKFDLDLDGVTRMTAAIGRG